MRILGDIKVTLNTFYNFNFQVSYREGYEPYLVLRKEGLPLYNVTFLGGFRDKVAHTLVLNATGYVLIILFTIWSLHKVII